jgi:hypothetical protein
MSRDENCRRQGAPRMHPRNASVTALIFSYIHSSITIPHARPNFDWSSVKRGQSRVDSDGAIAGMTS